MPPAGEQTPKADRISHGMSSRLLVISNGHGEDGIALRVISALQQRRSSLDIAVLPLVGHGHSYAAAEVQGAIQRIGPRQWLPSGGFSNQSLQGLLADLAAGMPLLSWRQWQVVRRWGQGGDPILAVGDLLPLAMAWSSGGRFGFVGTPKSDFTWASLGPSGWGASPLADGYHRAKGSEWDPWEWALMTSRRCRLVAVRDGLTARGLRRHGVPALAPGNPMMDGFRNEPCPAWLGATRRLLILPGSRHPEALGNAARLLTSLGRSPQILGSASPGGKPLTLLFPCGSGSEPGPWIWEAVLKAAGFSQQPLEHEAATIGAEAAWQLGASSVQVLLGSGCFERWAPWAEVGLATAGTATEQLVGLGIPALSLPGPGPQFKAGFARRQSRLLGGAVLPCRTGDQLADRLTVLLAEPPLRHQLGAIGQRRMGPAGGSEALAALVDQRLLG
jgi:uncharacterized protein (TIGR03492 family)